MQKRIFGFDLGIASIGWAVIELAQEDFNLELDYPEVGKIVGIGVRCFPKGENPKDGSSLAAPRRECRLARRRCRRKARRTAAIRQIFLQQHLVTEAELATIYAQQSGGDVWELRVKALTKPLTAVELARVLTHLAKHRGFKSYRQADEVKDKDNGKVLRAIKQNQAQLSAEYQTMAQLIMARAEIEEQKHPGEQAKKRNQANNYQNSIPRDAIQEELEKIFSCQQAYGIFTQQLHDDFCRIAFRYRPVQNISNMVGYCTLEPQEHRAPRSAPSAELFVAWGKINNMQIQDHDKKREPTEQERLAILALLYNIKEVKYSTIHSKVFAKNPNIKFLAVDYTRTAKADTDGATTTVDPEDEKFYSMQGYHALKQAVSRDVSPEAWQQLQQDFVLLDSIATILTCYKNDEDISKELSALKLDAKLIQALLTVSLQKFINLSLRALYKIIPWMQQGAKYDEACTQAGYDFKSTGASLVSVKGKLLAVIPNDKLTTVPTVNRAIAQFRKVYNAMVRRYGEPDQINLEMARELAKTPTERKKLYFKQLENQAVTQQAVTSLQEKDLVINGSNLLKYKLYQQQHGKCIYSGKPLDLMRCMTEDHYVEIDHIIPYSRSLNNSFNNKVLCLVAENQQKGNRTPYEYLGKDPEAWHKFTELVKSMSSLGKGKYTNLLMENYADREQEFRDSNAHDNSYIANYIKKYLEDAIDFSHSHCDIKNRIQVRSGSLTDYLRHQWGLTKVRAESDRHHAQDAVVIACATQGMVKYLSTISGTWERKTQLAQTKGHAWYKSLKRKLAEPWSGFHEEVQQKVANLFVSRSPQKNATGEIHKESIFPISKGKGSFPVRGGMAEKANMFRYDVFIKQGKYYIVPVYVVDVLSKNRQDIYYPIELDAQQQPKIIDDSYQFQCTLYKDSYVTLITKDAKEFSGYINQYNAQTGQLYLSPQDGSYSYILNTSSLEMEDFILFRVQDSDIKCQVVDYNTVEAKLILQSSVDSNEYYTIDAVPKNSKNDGKIKAYQTSQVYQKLSNEKKFNITTLKTIIKFEVDMLGNLIKVKQETRLPVNKAAK